MRCSSKNFSIELKTQFESFDYRDHLLLEVCIMYIEAIYGMVKKLPNEDDLPGYYMAVSGLWKENDKQLEIFRDMILPKLDKKIDKVLDNSINAHWK